MAVQATLARTINQSYETLIRSQHQQPRPPRARPVSRGDPRRRRVRILLLMVAGIITAWLRIVCAFRSAARLVRPARLRHQNAVVNLDCCGFANRRAWRFDRGAGFERAARAAASVVAGK